MLFPTCCFSTFASCLLTLSVWLDGNMSELTVIGHRGCLELMVISHCRWLELTVTGHSHLLELMGVDSNTYIHLSELIVSTCSLLLS